MLAALFHNLLLTRLNHKLMFPWRLLELASSAAYLLWMSHQSVFRWRYDRPLSLEQFQQKFPDDFSCAAYLAKKRWPNGFVCPHCGGSKGWKLRTRPWVWECGSDIADEHGELSLCRKQTSVIAGTIMHKTHLPLRQWFLAAHLITTHSNGISALQLQAKLGIGSYKTAWLLLHKLRRAMVRPDREPLGGPDQVVEIDETSVPFRTKDEPPGGGQGRSPIGKLNIIGAVEWRDEGRSGRIRLEPIRSNGRESLHPFVLKNTLEETTIYTDGNQAYQGIPGRYHESKVVKGIPAHLWFKRIHRVFALMKRWMMGVYHGIRRKHLDVYLQEFVFRWNRRRHFSSSFDSLLTIGNGVGHSSLRQIIGRPAVLKNLMERVRGLSQEHRLEAYDQALLSGVPAIFARRLLNPDYEPPAPRVYPRKKPKRPVLPKSKTAFVFATH